VYNISTDLTKDLVHVELEGFWAESDFSKFMDDLHSAVTKLRCKPGEHLLLCDLTRLNVMSQDIVSYVMSELNSEGPRDARWIAIVVGSALLKLQMQRMLLRANAQIFDDVGSAHEWLMASSGRSPV
jgi:hypothetical protein